ncbi:helix-turn-helix transcriptional regulator [Bacillaceae bacterium S4-13-58]
MSELHKQITYARENRGLSQKDLAERLGFSEEFISNLEHGKVDPPVSVLVKVTDVLNWSFNIGNVSI